MSEKALNWFAGLPPEVLSHAEFRLLSRLVWLHNEIENCAWPSYDYLEKKTGLSRGGIAKCMSSLEAKNIIKRKKIDGKTTHYFMCFEFGETSQLSEQADPELVNSVNETSQLSEPELVNSVDHIEEQDNNNDTKNTSPLPPKGAGSLVRHDLFGDIPSKQTWKGKLHEGCKSLDEEFERVWPHYRTVRNCPKKPAIKAWKTARRKATFEEIARPLSAYIKGRTGKDQQFTKHLSSWLNAESWTEEPEALLSGKESAQDRKTRLLSGQTRRQIKRDVPLQIAHGGQQ